MFATVSSDRKRVFDNNFIHDIIIYVVVITVMLCSFKLLHYYCHTGSTIFEVIFVLSNFYQTSKPLVY